ncbi:mobilization protein MobC [Pontibacter ummariensis]|uniref:Mobilisation protein (MobC) n=1 Tax=Pontibacter ummariensis TaxID=1610492 RepID=A0A239DWX9_9BACT|nr:plasmid mobilization relaxosome protein MobC [Pontibacter ummariensis]PRY13745.1 mobilization protein MobC [Pontibacter ummariensis]SNS36212.1 mobilisation protein (MobC) [Pontibacter ummariensis]
MENEQDERDWSYRGGRPLLGSDEKRDSVLQVRLTKQEHNDLKKQTAEQGYKDVSIYVRRKLFSADDAPAFNPKPLFRAIDKTGTELKRIGNNINQIARYAHYLEKNNMVEGKVIAEYNQHFEEFLKVEDAYVKAIRAFLRVTR